MTKKRPNFLFIMTDQQRADHLSCAGNKLLKTPNIDSLAKRGKRFDRFYVNSGICQTNRATIMTGQSVTQHGVRVNGIPISLDSVCFTHLLEAAGYDTALFGKAHFQNFTTDVPKEITTGLDLDRPPEQLRDSMLNVRSGPKYERELNFTNSTDPMQDELEGSYYGFKNFRVCTWHGDGVQGHYTHWLKQRFPEAEKNISSVNPEPDSRYTAPQARKPRMPAELYPTNYITEMTLDYIDNYVAGENNKPFFIQCSFNDPHHPFTPPGDYWDLYDPADVILSKSFYHQPHDQTPILARFHKQLADGEANRDWVLPYAVYEDEAKQITALTYGMIAFIDDSIGRILKKLSEHNLDEDTVIIFTSDHGDWMGDHGLMQKAILHYQGLIRVPFIWVDPNDPSPSSVSSDLACSQDIPNTILARAGLAPCVGMQGKDLTKLMFGTKFNPYDGILIQQATSNILPGDTKPIRVKTFVDIEWRLSYYADKDWGELYNIKEDPDEIYNLWDIQDYRETKLELIARMFEAMVDGESMSPIQVNVG